MARKGKGHDVSVKDLFAKSRAELLELARSMNVKVDTGALRAGLISALATAINRSPASQKVVAAGVTAAAKVVSRATRLSAGVKKTAAKAGANGKAAKAAVRSAVSKTAAKAGAAMKKAPARAARPAAPKPEAPPKADKPLGGETPPASTRPEKVVHGTGDADTAKFSLSEKPQRRQFPFDEGLGELPEGYASERLFAVARDPFWLFLYWDLSKGKWDEVTGAGNGRPYLRIHDVTDVVFDGSNAHKTIEFELPFGARSWYACVNAPARDFIAQLGSHATHGFVPVITSRRLRTPPDDFSARTDAQFVTIPIELPFARLREILSGIGGDGGEIARALARLQSLGVQLPFDYQPGGGEVPFDIVTGADGERYLRYLKGSEEMLEKLKREAQENVSSGASSSGRGGSLDAARFSTPAAGAGFFLEADVQVTVTGRTIPGAQVTVGAAQAPVDAEGRFRMPSPLPDGTKELPVRAVSADGAHRAGVDITVTRTTK